MWYYIYINIFGSTRPQDTLEDVIAYRSRRMLVICNVIIICSEEGWPSLHPFARWVWCVRYHRGADMYELQLGEGHLVHGVPTGMLHEWKVLPCLPVACMVDRASILSKRLHFFCWRTCGWFMVFTLVIFALMYWLGPRNCVHRVRSEAAVSIWEVCPPSSFAPFQSTLGLIIWSDFTRMWLSDDESQPRERL